ncbi:MAG: hypothetical protein ABSF83_09030 [Nitrososphaerales archaeon]
MSILNDVLRLVSDEISVQLKHSLEAYTRKAVRRAMKVLILCMVGLTFLGVGFVFMLYGTASYLAQFMFSGLAFGLVGLIAALVGLVLILLVRR